MGSCKINTDFCAKKPHGRSRHGKFTNTDLNHLCRVARQTNFYRLEFLKTCFFEMLKIYCMFSLVFFVLFAKDNGWLGNHFKSLFHNLFSSVCGITWILYLFFLFKTLCYFFKEKVNFILKTVCKKSLKSQKLKKDGKNIFN